MLLGLLALVVLTGRLWAIFWIGRQWFDYARIWPGIDSRGRKIIGVENLKYTGFVVGAFILNAILVAIYQPLGWFGTLAAIGFVIWRVKENLPVWLEGSKGRQMTAAPPPLSPLDQTKATLDNMQGRDPHRLESSVHGSARLAWVQHIGRTPVGLFADTILSQDALGDYGEVLPWYGYYLGHLSNPVWRDTDLLLPVRFAGDGHRIIVGPPGAGKFHSGIAPLLLDSWARSSSMVVFDPKDGELTIKTAGRRSKDSYIAVIDPYGITGFRQSRFNPLDLVRADDEHVIQRVEELREAILIPSHSSKDGDFWDTMARRMLEALILHVATSDLETDRTLMRVAEIVDAFVPIEVEAAMSMNPAGHGLVQRYAETVKALKGNRDQQRWNDICLTVQKSLFWLNTPQLRKSLATCDFDVGELIYGDRPFPGTVYIALPEKARSNAMAWMRVLYASLIDQLKDYPPNPGRHVHVVLDEFANLGRLDRVKNDLATTRGRYWHYHVAVQSLAQLRDLYGEGWEQMLGQCAIEQVLGVGDNFTAEYYSKAAGQTTKVFKTRSQSVSSGSSSSTGSNYGSGGHSSNSSSGSNYGSSDSVTTNIQAGPLFDAGQLRNLNETMQLVFSTGKPPAHLFKINVYEKEPEAVGEPFNEQAYFPPKPQPRPLELEQDREQLWERCRAALGEPLDYPSFSSVWDKSGFSGTNPVNLTPDISFEALVEHSIARPVIFVFWSLGNVRSRGFASAFQHYGTEQDSLLVVGVNDDGFPELSRRLGISVVPTVMAAIGGRLFPGFEQTRAAEDARAFIDKIVALYRGELDQ